MRFEDMLIIAGLVAVLLIVAWFVLRPKNAYDELDRPSQGQAQKRQSDRRIMDKPERVLLAKAQRLVREGNPHEAARILEDMHLFREAINVLEQARCFRDAADILKRMELPHRAGALLARNGLWQEAIACYQEAGMTDEVMRCTAELVRAKGLRNPNLIEAEKQKQLSNFVEAARLYAKAGDMENAYLNYNNHARYPAQWNQTNLGDTEARFIINTMVSRNLSKEIAAMLMASGHLPSLIIAYVRAQNFRDATSLLSQYSGSGRNDIRSALLHSFEMIESDKRPLAKIMHDAGLFSSAAFLYAQIREHENAGVCYEKAGDYEHAASSFDKAQLTRRAAEMRVIGRQMMQGGEDFGHAVGESAPILDITLDVQQNRADVVAPPLPGDNRNTTPASRSKRMQREEVVIPEEYRANRDSRENAAIPQQYRGRREDPSRDRASASVPAPAPAAPRAPAFAPPPRADFSIDESTNKPMPTVPPPQQTAPAQDTRSAPASNIARESSRDGRGSVSSNVSRDSGRDGRGSVSSNVSRDSGRDGRGSVSVSVSANAESRDPSFTRAPSPPPAPPPLPPMARDMETNIQIMADTSRDPDKTSRFSVPTSSFAIGRDEPTQSQVMPHTEDNSVMEETGAEIVLEVESNTILTPKNEQRFYEIYVIVQGTVKVFQNDVNGKSIVADELGAGDAFSLRYPELRLKRTLYLSQSTCVIKVIRCKHERMSYI